MLVDLFLEGKLYNLGDKRVRFLYLEIRKNILFRILYYWKYFLKKS